MHRERRSPVSSIREYALACCVLWFCAFLVAMYPARSLAQPAPLPLREIVRVGGDFGPSELLFTYISDIAVGRDGAIYVGDSRQASVTVLDSAGGFVRSIGREGSGPGEFQLPSDLQVDSQLVVFDTRLQRVSTFELDGRHIRTEAAPSPHGLSIWDAAASGSGIVGQTPNMFSRQVPPDQDGVVAVVFASDEAVDTLLTYKAGGSIWVAERSWSTTVSPTGPGGAWLAFQDTVVTADGITGEIRWYSTGTGLKLEREAELGQRGRPVTEADIERFTEELRRAKPHIPPSVELYPPGHWSIATSLVYGYGFLWIRNGTDQSNGDLYTTFNTRTGVTQQWRLPSGFLLLAVSGDRLYGRELTENGSPMVVVYEIARERSGPQ